MDILGEGDSVNRGPASLASVEGGGANVGVGFGNSRKEGKQALRCDAERNKEPLMGFR